MKVGDKVWFMLGGEWGKAVVVAAPEGAVPRRGSVFVRDELFQDVYRVPKHWVKERND